MNILNARDVESAKLNKLHSQILDKKKEILDVRNARITAEELRSKMLKVAQDEIVRSGADVCFENFSASDPRLGFIPSEFRLGHVFWLMGAERFADVVAEKISQDTSQPQGLPHAERLKEINRLTDELQMLERAEELEVIRLESLGHTVIRRKDVNVELLFDVWQDYKPNTTVTE